MRASGTDFQNTGLLPTSAKLAVKYRPGRWNTGHLATLACFQILFSLQQELPVCFKNTFSNCILCTTW